MFLPYPLFPPFPLCLAAPGWLRKTSLHSWPNISKQKFAPLVCRSLFYDTLFVCNVPCNTTSAPSRWIAACLQCTGGLISCFPSTLTRKWKKPCKNTRPWQHDRDTGWLSINQHCSMTFEPSNISRLQEGNAKVSLPWAWPRRPHGPD